MGLLSGEEQEQASTPATQALEELGIPFRLFQHAGPIDSLEQAARERGQQPGQVVRSIVFRLAEEEYVMVLLSGPGQVSWSVLRRYLGRSRLTMANGEELRLVTGSEPGTVSPFGLPRAMRVLVDESVFENEDVSLGSGVRGLAIMMRVGDLLRAVKEVEVGKFREEG
jgi:Cys-tRNA(Pro)/Cys-tRNA(Cys) deacylase